MPKLKSSTSKQTVETPEPNIAKRASDNFPLVPVADLGTPSSGKKNPWLRFYHPNSKLAAEVRAAIPGIQTGHAYVSIPEESGTEYYAVQSIQMLTASLYFSDVQLVGGEMKLLRVQREEPPRSDTKMSRDILAVVLAHTAEGVFPCVASFRKAAAPALQTLSIGIRDAGDWRAVVGLLTYDACTSKTSGFGYTRVGAIVKSIDAKQAKAVAKLLSQEPCELLEAALEGYTAKCAEYDNLVNGGTPK